MGIEHATLRDLSEYGISLVLLAGLLLPPGFVLGWWLNVLDFRKRPASGQWCLALLLSLGVCPIVTYLLGTLVSLTCVWLFHGLAALGLPLVLWLRRHQETAPDDALWPLLLAGGLWCLLTAFALCDLESGSGLTRCLAHYDHAKHAAVTDAVLRTGLPPANPSFHPGEPKPLYYYYFWQMFGGLAGRLGGDCVSPRTLAIAGVAWAGFALLAAVRLCLSLANAMFSASAYALAFGFLLITGLDLIPVLIQRMQGTFIPHLEWWNVNQATSWVAVGLWVPHHLVGLTAVVLSWSLLRDAALTDQPWRRRLDVLLAGLALASATGLSIWVALMAFLSLGVWWLFALRHGLWQEVRLVPLVVIVAGLALLPFAHELKSAQTESRFPLALSIRSSALVSPIQSTLVEVHPALVSLSRLLALPFDYALEFGVFLFAGLIYAHQRRTSGTAWHRDEQFLAVMTVTSLLACALLSSVVRNNDFGARGLLLAQFCLLLAAQAVVLGPLRENLRRWLVLLALIGLSGTAYELVVPRQFTAGDAGSEALDLRRAYTWIREHTPRQAIVQHSWKEYRKPTGGGLWTQAEGPHEPFHLLYGHRQAAVSDEMHGMLFGVSQAQFDAVAEPIARLFESGVSRDEARAVCQRFGIDVLVVKRADPIAGDPTGWANQTRPVFANDAARVYILAEFLLTEP